MLPGRTLHRLAALICSPVTLEHVVEPAIADLQKEYVEAGGRRVWTLVTGYVAILKVIGMCAISPSIASEKRSAALRTTAWSLTLTVAFTAMLMLPPLSIVEGKFSWILLVALIPQAVPLAVPIGLAFGIALGMAGRSHDAAGTRVILLAAVLASLASFVTLGWAMPASNQAFRESRARTAGVAGPLTKGPNEMTFSELGRHAETAAAAGHLRTAAGYAWAFHLRFALPAASVALAWFLCAIGVRRTAHRALIAVIACLTYWALIFVGEGLAVYSPVAPALAGTIPTVVGAWLPNIVFAAATVFIASSRTSRILGSLGPEN